MMGVFLRAATILFGGMGVAFLAALAVRYGVPLLSASAQADGLAAGMFFFGSVAVATLAVIDATSRAART